MQLKPNNPNFKCGPNIGGWSGEIIIISVCHLCAIFVTNRDKYRPIGKINNELYKEKITHVSY